MNQKTLLKLQYTAHFIKKVNIVLSSAKKSLH